MGVTLIAATSFALPTISSRPTPTASPHVRAAIRLAQSMLVLLVHTSKTTPPASRAAVMQLVASLTSQIFALAILILTMTSIVPMSAMAPMGAWQNRILWWERQKVSIYVCLVARQRPQPQLPPLHLLSSTTPFFQVEEGVTKQAQPQLHIPGHS